jgi:hypothetical protein
MLHMARRTVVKYSGKSELGIEALARWWSQQTQGLRFAARESSERWHPRDLRAFVASADGRPVLRRTAAHYQLTYQMDNHRKHTDGHTLACEGPRPRAPSSSHTFGCTVRCNWFEIGLFFGACAPAPFPLDTERARCTPATHKRFVGVFQGRRSFASPPEEVGLRLALGAGSWRRLEPHTHPSLPFAAGVDLREGGGHP